MSKDAPATFELSAELQSWLVPLDADPCGPDLEYDPEMLELAMAAAGKPESQFAPASPPDWSRVQELCVSLFQRTRDLRVAVMWGRSQLSLVGYGALPSALALLIGLVDAHWEHLHPLPDPDDGEAFARVSALGGLDKLDSLLGDLRQSLLVADRRAGGLRVRDVEIAMEKLAARADDDVRTQGQITGLLQDMPEHAQVLREQTAAAQSLVKQLHRTMSERVGDANAVETKTLRAMLGAIEAVLPAVAVESEEGGAGDGNVGGAATGSGAVRRGSGGVHSVDSRRDAIRAIELVCAYLESAEPSNPAQLLLRRAARLIEKDFLQLMRELAPEALAEVARIMGVDPDSVPSDRSG